MMDLSPPIDALRSGLRPGWKQTLKAAEKRELAIIGGNDESLFETVIDIYNEMVSRKRFSDANDIRAYRRIQALLPDPLKIRVSVCESAGDRCAGLVWSAIGDSALFFAATRQSALKNGAAYALQWNLVEQLKQAGVQKYNLNGVNPDQPGIYYFKRGLAGKSGSEVSYISGFAACDSVLSCYCVTVAERMRAMYEGFRKARVSG